MHGGVECIKRSHIVINNHNDNEVFECTFSTEPKARTTNNQTKRRKVPDTKNSHATRTNVSLTSLSLHLYTHTHIHTHVHMHAHTHTAHTHTCVHIQ